MYTKIKSFTHVQKKNDFPEILGSGVPVVEKTFPAKKRYSTSVVARVKKNMSLFAPDPDVEDYVSGWLCGGVSTLSIPPVKQMNDLHLMI